MCCLALLHLTADYGRVRASTWHRGRGGWACGRWTESGRRTWRSEEQRIVLTQDRCINARGGGQKSQLRAWGVWRMGQVCGRDSHFVDGAKRGLVLSCSGLFSFGCLVELLGFLPSSYFVWILLRTILSVFLFVMSLLLLLLKSSLSSFIISSFWSCQRNTGLTRYQKASIGEVLQSFYFCSFFFSSPCHLTSCVSSC